jgi:signal transduction histidine kinase/ActR/RegA family two-component response regulator
MSERSRGTSWLTGPRAARLVSAGIGVVLTVLAALALGGALAGGRSAERLERSHRLAEAYLHAQRAFSKEDAIEDVYDGRSPRVAREFDRAASELEAALEALVRTGEPADRSLARRAQPAHRAYASAMRDVFAALDRRDRARAEQINDERADPAQDRLQPLVNRFGAQAITRLDPIEDVREDERRFLQIASVVVPLAVVVYVLLLVVLRAYRRRLARAAHRAAQAERLESVGQLAGGVAHDFNNLLAVILSHAAFAAEELPEGTQAREDVDEVRRAGERAAELVRQLLVFSHRHPSAVEPVDVREVLLDTERLLRRTLGEHIQLTTNCPEPLPNVLADRQRLQQALMNVAINARDAMPTGGTITVEASAAELEPERAAALRLQPGRVVRITVADEGSGMDDEVLARAFEPFFTTKPREHGSGLGLASAHAAITQMGGHIELRSEHGAGTVAEIVLPVTAATAASDPDEPEDTRAGGGRLVLLVEDEDQVRRVVRRILESHGFAVVDVRSGEEALLQWRTERERIDVVLTDVVMPGMSGGELVRRLHGDEPGLPAVFMSGYADEIVDRFGQAGGDVPTIAKPFDAADLVRLLDDVVERDALSRDRRASPGR